MNDIILTARGLSRSYLKYPKAEGLRGSMKALFLRRRPVVVRALSDFDLELRRGEVLGLVGPNGAGKTTIVKLLAGLMRPDSGELSALGFQPSERREGFLSRIALVMGQRSQLWPDLPARDSLLLNKAIYGIPEARFRASLERLAGALEAERLLELPVRTLSLGERMRMEFIAAMIHEPELVFLDEPTIGLDAPAQKRIREFLRRENEERGLAVVLTSHYMDDIRKLCPRTALLLGGRKEYDGPTEAMFARVRERKLLRLSFGPDGPPPAGSVPWEVVESGPSRLVLSLRPDEVKEALAFCLAACDVADVSVEEEEIADSVEKLYRGEACRAE